MVKDSTPGFVEFGEEEIEQSIPARFGKQARQFPERCAVRTAAEQISYADLDRFSNRIARAVLEKSSSRENPIALLFDPGVSMIAAILGVLKAGGFYLPLDPGAPSARNAALLASSRAVLIVADSKNEAAAQALAAEGLGVLCADRLPEVSEAPVQEAPGPEDLFCVLYTSGSTGAAKGVLHNHRNFLHSIREHTNSLKIAAADRISFLSSYGHVAGVTSILRALLNGATLCIFNLRAEGWGELPRWMIAEGITIYQSVPTLFRQWAQTLGEGRKIPDLRILHLGGEPVTIQDVALYQKHTAEHCILVHNLGSTEVPTFRQFFINRKTALGGNVVPVGYAVAGKDVILIDETGAAAGVNQTGEIVVKSRYLALGYWQEPELTRAAFHSAGADGEERLFHTGDLGRLRADGCLEHWGRKDRQVKIRGIRIEPAEIEAVLGQHPLLRQAAVVAREDARGEKQLAAYVVAAPGASPSSSALREYLRELLPAHMVPTAFVTLGQLPLTANGKVDQSALPSPEFNVRHSDVPFVAPRTALEKTIVRTWEEVLGVPGVGIHDRFLDLGGNSLRAMQVISRLQNALEGVFPLESLFSIASVAEQAAAVERYLSASPEEDDEDQFLAELEAMPEEEAERRLAEIEAGNGSSRKKSHWQTAAVSKTYLDVRSAIPGAALEVDVMLKLIRTWNPKPQRAIDLGCGDGFLGRTLLEHFPECHVFFVDFSAPMLEAARAELGGSARATIIKADFTTPGWIKEAGAGRPFDLVISGLSIHHQTDPRKRQLYAEIYELLSDGGIFLNLEQVASATAEIEGIYGEYFIDALHAFRRRSEPDLLREAVAAGYYASPARKENRLAPVEAQCGWLREIGFHDVDCFFKILEHAMFGGRKPAGGAKI